MYNSKHRLPLVKSFRVRFSPLLVPPITTVDQQLAEKETSRKQTCLKPSEHVSISSAGRVSTSSSTRVSTSQVETLRVAQVGVQHLATNRNFSKCHCGQHRSQTLGYVVCHQQVHVLFKMTFWVALTHVLNRQLLGCHCILLLKRHIL